MKTIFLAVTEHQLDRPPSLVTLQDFKADALIVFG